MFVSNPETQHDAEVLASRMREVPPEETVTFTDLSKTVGRDVRKHCWYALVKARRMLEREGVYFGAVRNVGFKRMSDSIKVDSTASDCERSRRLSRRAINKLESVNFESLAPEKKREHVMRSAQLMAVHMFSTKKAADKLKQLANNVAKPTIGETLQLFATQPNGK